MAVLTYCYRRLDNGELVELHMTPEEMVQRQREDGTIQLGDGTYGQRDFRAEHGIKDKKNPGWPRESVAAGVAEEDRQQAIDEARQNGVPTDFTWDANPIFRSHEHEKKYLKTVGLRNKDDFY